MSAIPMNKNKTTKLEYDIIDNGDLPARITRFVGLGVQDQPKWDNQVKQPAFKAAFEFELIDVDATGRVLENKEDEWVTKEEFDPKPACLFQDYFLFPGAERGKVYDLCKAIDPSIKKVPSDIQWFIDNLLDQVVTVRVGNYTLKNGDNAGQKRNKVELVSAMPEMFKKAVGPARRELVGFDPYLENDTMFSAYSDLFPFQRNILAEAHDSDNIVYAGQEPAKPDMDARKNEKAETKDEKSAGAATDSTSDAQDFDEDMPF